MDRLASAELDELHYDWEIAYGQLIRESVKRSPRRRSLVSEAYKGLIEILAERRRRAGRRLDTMGFCENYTEEIASMLGPPPASLLDIGCSTGVFVSAMLARGYQACGIDVSEECIRLGCERLRTQFPEAIGNVRVGDFLSYPFEAGSYDLVFSNDVLEHIPPDEADDFLSKVFQVLKPGGLLWIITVNRWSGPGDATTVKHPLGTPSRGLHLKEYTLGELAALLRRNGFR
ncbi:MAG: class I SAM-dependent methyltransferase, partial [Bryobacteraceae bacterium]